MKSLQRNYSGKDVEMLLTAAAITERALINKNFLQSRRISWKDPFFEQLKTRIDETIKTYLGVDSAKGQRQSTRIVKDTHKTALALLIEFKVQLVADYKNDKTRRDELLKELGFTDHLKDARQRGQQALVNLLYQFKTNMDKGLESEIIKKGINPATIAAITDLAADFKDRNIRQEGFKSSKKETTVAAIIAFNEIYDDVISICKIAANFFKEDQVKAAQFNFSKVKAALTSAPSKAIDNAPVPAII